MTNQSKVFYTEKSCLVITPNQWEGIRRLYREGGKMAATLLIIDIIARQCVEHDSFHKEIFDVIVKAVLEENRIRARS